MDLIYFIIGGILFIAFGTGLIYTGQYLDSKKSSDVLIGQLKKLQDEVDIKDKKISELESWENKISIKLTETLYQSMISFYETIQEYSTAKIDTISLESFKVLCKGCKLDLETRMRKSIIDASHYTLKEYLLYNWNKIYYHLDEINSASTYIPPNAYELFLRIKEKRHYIYALSQSNYEGNPDLEPWHATFFDIYNLTIELKDLIDNIKTSEQ